MGSLLAELKAGAATDAAVWKMLDLRIFVEGLRIVAPKTPEVASL
jgi:hypothetical protein